MLFQLVGLPHLDDEMLVSHTLASFYEPKVSAFYEEHGKDAINRYETLLDRGKENPSDDASSYIKQALVKNSTKALVAMTTRQGARRLGGVTAEIIQENIGQAVVTSNPVLCAILLDCCARLCGGTVSDIAIGHKIEMMGYGETDDTNSDCAVLLPANAGDVMFKFLVYALNAVTANFLKIYYN